MTFLAITDWGALEFWILMAGCEPTIMGIGAILK